MDFLTATWQRTFRAARGHVSPRAQGRLPNGKPTLPALPPLGSAAELAGTEKQGRGQSTEKRGPLPDADLLGRAGGRKGNAQAAGPQDVSVMQGGAASLGTLLGTGRGQRVERMATGVPRQTEVKGTHPTRRHPYRSYVGTYVQCGSRSEGNSPSREGLLAHS